jgi:protein O-mannosyl-transferase
MSLLLVLVTLALYWPARHYDFVQYDDPEYVSENPTVREGLTRWGLVWAVVDAHASNWHPLSWASHMLDCQLFGLNAGAHHLVNVLLHCANAALLFLLLEAMTGAFWRSGFVAAIFAWHPLRVESVAWISERKDVLSGLFFMLTLWAYVQYAKRSNAPGPPSSVSAESLPSATHGSEGGPAPSPTGAVAEGSERGLFYRLSLVLFVLGLLAKPMVVTVPGVLLLLDFWPLRRFPGAGSASGGAGTLSLAGKLVLEKLPFIFFSVGVSVITFLAQKAGGAVVSLQSEGLSARLAHALAGYLVYMEKVFLPRDLAVLYLRPQTVPPLTLAAAAALLLFISTMAVLNLHRRPYLAVGWLWFLGTLLPVSGLVQAGLQSVADRYTYLAAIGLSLMLAWGVGDLTAARSSIDDRPGCRAGFGLAIWSRLRKPLAATATGFVLLTCAVLTRHQLGYWRNTETLMNRTLQIDPNNYVAHQDLGVYFARIGQTEQARFHRQRVRELDPALAGDSSPGSSPQSKAIRGSGQ